MTDESSSTGSPKVELLPTFESMFSSIKQRVTFSKGNKKQPATSTDLGGNAAGDIQQVGLYLIAICSLLQTLPQTAPLITTKNATILWTHLVQP